MRLPLYMTLLLVAMPLLLLGQTKPWTLIWQDEFSKDGIPDEANWRFTGRWTPAWQCYCTDDTSTAFVRDGILYLKGIVSHERGDTATFRTGCIETRHKFSFKYGRLEVKAKIPMVMGSWPAIWLMPQNDSYGGWPASGEIDVMEHLNRDQFVYHTVHSGYIELEGHKQDPLYVWKAPFDSNDFNIYGVEWSAERIDFFINGVKTFTYPKLKGGPLGQWPFDQPFYIILDMALGGCSWLAAPAEGDLPAVMEVDWIRVYQQNIE